MKKFIIGTSLLFLSYAAAAQQVYDSRYCRTIDTDKQIILEFFNKNSSNKAERLIGYDYDTKKVTDLSASPLEYSVSTDENKLKSMNLTSKNIILAHSHDYDANTIRRQCIDDKRKYKKIKKINDALLMTRVLNEFPSYSDLREYEEIRTGYDILDEHYIEREGKLYSFSIPKEVSIDSALKAYRDIIIYLKKNYCSAYDKPERCKELDKKEISILLNVFTPIKVFEYDAQDKVIQNSDLPLITKQDTISFISEYAKYLKHKKKT